MSSKIFISYRREDTAANALGIGQYLEHQFGHKNVFIDVDMRAGAKFPDVLQQRLAECKVVLVLIGPGWLNAHDEQGRRRLDNPDDWVRLEIAHALKRSVTVIPVRINGAALPTRDELPDDIRGLLDHQATSVTTTGFRNEMAGLARDIRAIPSAHAWRRLAPVAASVFVVLAASALIYSFGSQRLLQHPTAQTPPSATAQTPPSANHGAIWSSKPGEWVMFAWNNTPAAYYFKPSSVKMFGDKLVYTERVALKITNETEPSNQTAAYQDDEAILGCKTPTWAEAEVTSYNRAGEVISHFKRFDPSTDDLSSVGQPLAPTSIAVIAHHLLCNEQLRTPLLTKQQSRAMKLSFLSPFASGDRDIFHSVPEPTGDRGFPFSAVLVTKFHKEQALAGIFPGQTILGLPPSYSTTAESVRIDCVGRSAEFAKTDYYDAENNLIYVFAPVSVQPVWIKGGSPVALLADLACTPKTHEGTYEGTNTSTYKSGGEAEQKITINVLQSGDDLTVSFQTPTGGRGKGQGKLSGDAVNSLTLQSTVPECPGSYTGSLKFAGDTMSWSFEGSDCGGSMEGRGTAKRTKA